MLNLSGNQITDITPLSSLTDLRALSIERNSITDLTPLSSLTNLSDLRLSGNEIDDLTPLENLTKLSGTLRLNHNNISDISPLLNLTNLYLVSLVDNPLSLTSINVYIPKLRELGIKVRYTVDENAILWGKLKNNALLQNYPNPFNPETWIPYQLARESDVVIRIYDIKGKLVRTLSLGKKPSGTYVTKEKAAFWDGKTEEGNLVSSGVYFYTLYANGEEIATRKMIMLK